MFQLASSRHAADKSAGTGGMDAAVFNALDGVFALQKLRVVKPQGCGFTT